MCASVARSAGAQQASLPEIPTGQQLVDLTAELDSKLLTAYTTCDIDTFVSMMASDIENDHDEVGRLVGREAAKNLLVEGVCATLKKGIKPRRELMAGSLEVYRIAQFGALEFARSTLWLRRSGEHETESV